MREIIKPSYITPTSIWIVATGEGWAGTRSALGAHVSTDLTEEESSDHLRSFGGRIGRDVHSLLANFESFNDPDVVCGLLDELDGRFLVGLYDRRPPITRLVSTLVFDPASSAFMDQTIFDGMRDRFRSALDIRLAGDFEASTQALDDALATHDPMVMLAALQDGLALDTDVESYVRRNYVGIVDRIERYRPERLLDVSDQACKARNFHAHYNAWGQRHRFIEAVCGSGPAGTPIDLTPPMHFYGLEHQPLRHQGQWRAWRASRPVAFLDRNAHPALQLAALIGFAAVAVNGWPEDVGASPRNLIAQNYYGDVCFSKEHAAAWKKLLMGYAMESSDRDTAWSFAPELGDRLPDGLRLATLIDGCDMRSTRDRLLMKMTGRGLGAGAILALRIEALDVDPHGALFDRDWNTAVPILEMDSVDETDLWRLVRRNERLDGFLFSPLDDSVPYGRNRLSRAQFNAILAERLAEFAARDASLETA